MTVEAETQNQMTDAELMDRIRSIQTELSSIDARVGQLCEEVDSRKATIAEIQDRGRDLNNELHDLVAVPCRLWGFM